MIDKFHGDYRWLSNFWLAPVELDGLIYPSVENAYQAAKVPKEDRAEFLTCSPGKSKRLWKKFDLHPHWDERKEEIMHALLKQKFTFGTLPSILLAATGDEELVEGNNWGDTFWGIDVDQGGENRLGRMIMQLRNELPKEIMK